MNVKKMLHVCTVLALVAGIFVARAARAGNGVCPGNNNTLWEEGLAWNQTVYLWDNKSWGMAYVSHGIQSLGAERNSNSINCIQAAVFNAGTCAVHDSTNDGNSNYDNSGDCNYAQSWYIAYN